MNIGTPDMVGTAADCGPDESEPAALGLKLAPSARVAPPRLADAPAAIECVRMLGLSLCAERSLPLGCAVGLVARDGLIDPETLRVDWGGNYPVAQLFTDRYAKLKEIARHPIPQPGRA